MDQGAWTYRSVPLAVDPCIRTFEAELVALLAAAADAVAVEASELLEPGEVEVEVAVGCLDYGHIVVDAVLCLQYAQLDSSPPVGNHSIHRLLVLPSLDCQIVQSHSPSTAHRRAHK